MEELQSGEKSPIKGELNETIKAEEEPIACASYSQSHSESNLDVKSTHDPPASVEDIQRLIKRPKIVHEDETQIQIKKTGTLHKLDTLEKEIGEPEPPPPDDQHDSDTSSTEETYYEMEDDSEHEEIREDDIQDLVLLELKYEESESEEEIIVVDDGKHKVFYVEDEQEDDDESDKISISSHKA